MISLGEALRAVGDPRGGPRMQPVLEADDRLDPVTGLASCGVAPTVASDRVRSTPIGSPRSTSLSSALRDKPNSPPLVSTIGVTRLFASSPTASRSKLIR